MNYTIDTSSTINTEDSYILVPKKKICKYEAHKRELNEKINFLVDELYKKKKSQLGGKKEEEEQIKLTTDDYRDFERSLLMFPVTLSDEEVTGKYELLSLSDGLSSKHGYDTYDEEEYELCSLTSDDDNFF